MGQKGKNVRDGPKRRKKERNEDKKEKCKRWGKKERM